MKRSIGKMTMLALGFCGFTALSGIACSPRGTGAAAVQNDRTGSATIALQLPGGLTINTVTYSITGPAAFSQSGSIDVSHSTTVSTVIGGLPAQATSGTISNPTAQNPSFTCVTPGAASVTVKVSDGDAAAGCAPSVTTQVTCTGSVAGVVASSLFVAGSTTDPTVQGRLEPGVLTSAVHRIAAEL